VQSLASAAAQISVASVKVFLSAHLFSSFATYEFAHTPWLRLASSLQKLTPSVSKTFCIHHLLPRHGLSLVVVFFMQVLVFHLEQHRTACFWLASLRSIPASSPWHTPSFPHATWVFGRLDLILSPAHSENSEAADPTLAADPRILHLFSTAPRLSTVFLGQSTCTTAVDGAPPGLPVSDLQSLSKKHWTSNGVQEPPSENWNISGHVGFGLSSWQHV